MKKYNKCKFLIITDKKTKKKYSFPKHKKYLDFREFVRENDPQSDFWNIHFDPIENQWYLVSTINGYVDDKNKPLAKIFSVSSI